MSWMGPGDPPPPGPGPGLTTLRRLRTLTSVYLTELRDLAPDIAQAASTDFRWGDLLDQMRAAQDVGPGTPASVLNAIAPLLGEGTS